MVSKKRRENEKEKMRKLILNASVKIILEDGYDKLSMRKIADKIEYSATTIYLYYKDKNEIVEDISIGIYEKIVKNIKNVLENNKNLSIEKQIELSFKEFIYSITDNPEMGRAVIRSGTSAMLGPRNEREDQEITGIDMLGNLLVKGQEEKVFSKIEEFMPLMIISSLIGFSMNAIENRLYEDDNWDNLVDKYSRLLLDGLLYRERD
ncbi:MAG: TetR/AcrR family transcriptional regulator [Miniphocaeibacter sp.]|uniref:TetR/AcrR family transcriptional regulator n=1 Tax=Miniphocaeibacter sp. TaxID=3100973 RepID=UPI00179BB02F|nr:TetR/AcrR family transcriptional regulator [Gallicola sp.]